MNSALAPGPSSYQNQSPKNPAMASTSILHHTQPAGTSTQAFVTTATATNHLQSTSALQQLDQSAQQPVLQPALRLDQSIPNQPANDINNSAARIQSEAAPVIIPSMQVLPVQAGANIPLALPGIGPQSFQHTRTEQAIIPPTIQILPTSAGVSVPFAPTMVGPQLFQHTNISNPAAMTSQQQLNTMAPRDPERGYPHAVYWPQAEHTNYWPQAENTNYRPQAELRYLAPILQTYQDAHIPYQVTPVPQQQAHIGSGDH